MVAWNHPLTYVLAQKEPTEFSPIKRFRLNRLRLVRSAKTGSFEALSMQIYAKNLKTNPEIKHPHKEPTVAPRQ
jgi:hypothetical protein